MDPLQKMAALNPTQKARTLLEEFRNFAFKGNVVDLAVGVIIGAAFGQIIKSLVDNIIMPLISFIPAFDKGYTEWAIHFEGKTIPYGKFLGDVASFLVVAAALFLFIVKFLGWLMRTKREEAATPPPPTRDQELLAEIRDLLKNERARPATGAGGG
jgi:large conductance mechanosensitive channel